MGKPVVVMVDDQEFMCGLVEDLLENTCEVRSFTSGREALEFLPGNKVDLVLLDYEMPEMTGYEVLTAIGEDKRTAGIPVIFLTGVMDQQLETEMLSRGAAAYIKKPINASELHRIIALHIGS
jgi:CheY-like chemotaxis protein